MSSLPQHSASWLERVRSLPQEEKEKLRTALTPRLTKWIPIDLTVTQRAFLLLPQTEALFGGAAGGGKSWAILAAALQYADVPGYNALILRRNYADLSLPGALMDIAAQWFAGTAARWNEQKKTWSFPTGGFRPATLTFGYMENDSDVDRYDGAAFHYVGWDELTQFPEYPYRYLFSRRRKPVGMNVPLRTRAASNPGKRGHKWVKKRFMDEGAKYGRIFIPSRIKDNPYLDETTYLEGLKELDPVTLARLRDGDWSARESGGMFLAEWFENLLPQKTEGLRWVRYWDLAATEKAKKKKKSSDPDFTAGCLLGLDLKTGRYQVADMRRCQSKPADVESLIRRTAANDGKKVPIFMEQEPGSAGIHLIDHYRRHVLRGYMVHADKVTGDKATRAGPASNAAMARNIDLVEGDWITEFTDELEAFPAGAHDDQVDAFSGAFEKVQAPLPSFAF